MTEITQRLVTELQRMFAAYGMTPDPIRLDAYLEIFEENRLQDAQVVHQAINKAMAESKGFPPGPGHVIQCAKESVYSPHGYQERVPQREAGARLGAGDPRHALPATLDGFEKRVSHPQAPDLFARAKEIRQEAKLVPGDPVRSRTLSYVRAADELGIAWPLESRHKRQLDGWMREWEAAGGDADWWWKRA